VNFNCISYVEINRSSGELAEIRVRLIPLLDMCDITEDRKPLVAFQPEYATKNYLCFLIGDPEKPFQITQCLGGTSLHFFLKYGYVPVPGTPVIENEVYKLNLNLASNKPFLKRRKSALFAVGLKTPDTFELQPKYFLNRTVKADEAKLTCKKLFTFVQLCIAENGKLNSLLKSQLLLT